MHEAVERAIDLPAAPLPSLDDLDAFLEQADEISRQVEGLKSGKLQPNFVSVPVSRKVPQALPAPEPPRTPEQEAALKEKVQELLAQRRSRERARVRYQSYLEETSGEDLRGTDYKKWDLFLPSDDEDEDLVNSQRPELKALEKDAEDRHRRWEPLAVPEKFPQMLSGSLIRH